MLSRNWHVTLQLKFSRYSWLNGENRCLKDQKWSPEALFWPQIWRALKISPSKWEKSRPEPGSSIAQNSTIVDCVAARYLPPDTKKKQIHSKLNHHHHQSGRQFACRRSSQRALDCLSPVFAYAINPFHAKSVSSILSVESSFETPNIQLILRITGNKNFQSQRMDMSSSILIVS